MMGRFHKTIPYNKLYLETPKPKQFSKSHLVFTKKPIHWQKKLVDHFSMSKKTMCYRTKSGPNVNNQRAIERTKIKRTHAKARDFYTKNGRAFVAGFKPKTVKFSKML